MRTRGQSERTEMEPVEVFARIKTVSNTEVSKDTMSFMNIRGVYLVTDCHGPGGIRLKDHKL